MGALSNLYSTSIGKKIIMALTGLVLFGFTIGHMSGNLLIFAGPDAINSYAHTLKETTPLLWGTRIAVVVSIVLHAWSAISLVRLNQAARPKSYGKWEAKRSTFASRTMKFGGVIVGLFFLFHIAHYTAFLVEPDYGDWMTKLEDGTPVHDVFRMVTTGFANPVVVLTYLVAMGAFFLHMRHGVWSLLQTLGMNHPEYNAFRKSFASGMSIVLFVGFSSVPVACLLRAYDIVDLLSLIH